MLWNHLIISSNAQFIFQLMNKLEPLHASRHHSNLMRNMGEGVWRWMEWGQGRDWVVCKFTTLKLRMKTTIELHDLVHYFRLKPPLHGRKVSLTAERPPLMLRGEAGVDPESSAGGANYGERGSASLYGGLGACPQWGPGAKPLVRGQGDEVPLKLTRFCNFKFKFLMKNAPFLRNLNRIHYAENINADFLTLLGGGDASLYGGLGACPQWGPGEKPLVRGSGENINADFLTLLGGALAPVAPSPPWIRHWGEEV